jgi:hypothetical protein
MKPVVWLSQPTPEQQNYFSQRGWEVIVVDTSAEPFASGAAAWQRVRKAADGRTPDAVMGIIPLQILGEYLKAAGSCPLLQADMEAVRGATPPRSVWKGTFTQTVKVEILKRAWGIEAEAPLTAEQEQYLRHVPIHLPQGGRVEVRRVWALPADAVEDLANFSSANGRRKIVLRGHPRHKVDRYAWRGRAKQVGTADGVNLCKIDHSQTEWLVVAAEDPVLIRGGEVVATTSGYAFLNVREGDMWREYGYKRRTSNTNLIRNGKIVSPDIDQVIAVEESQENDRH